MFALVDCNNFYASCERVFRPDLIGKPIVVLSNNDGCVIARSSEAKESGIPMGAPAFKFKHEFEQKNIHVFSSNYALYGDMSARVMDLLGTYTPDLEIYSIDEAFLRFDTGVEDYQGLGLEIQRSITKSTGIPISIGLAPTKALSKVANRIAKKFQHKTNNVYVIDDDEKRIKALKWIIIEDVWGIGRGNTKRLEERGITNAYEFTQLSDEWVKKNLGVIGLRLKHELEGISRLGIDTVEDRKNIATTRSFEEDYSEYELVKERVVTFAVSCAEKLRTQKSCCSSILVMLRTNRFRQGTPQYKKSVFVPLPFATNSSLEISRFAEEGLQKIFRKGLSYKRAGVIVMDLTPEENSQLGLFNNSDPRHRSLMKTMDHINKNIGQHKVKLGSQDLKRTWKMRQEKVSPKYTTRLSDIINISV